jgi:hypothetical protein
MNAPVLFSARDGVVLFQFRPIPDWVAHETRRAINREGLEVPFESPAFGVWLAAYEQLRDAVIYASNQRRIAIPSTTAAVATSREEAAQPLDRELSR